MGSQIGTSYMQSLINTDCGCYSQVPKSYEKPIPEEWRLSQQQIKAHGFEEENVMFRCPRTFGHMVYYPQFNPHLINNGPCALTCSVFVCLYAVAGRDAGVLSQCQSGVGRLQAGHEDGPQRHERALQTQTHSCHPRAGEDNDTHLLNLFAFFSMKAQPVSVCTNGGKPSLK